MIRGHKSDTVLMTDQEMKSDKVLMADQQIKSDTALINDQPARIIELYFNPVSAKVPGY